MKQLQLRIDCEIQSNRAGAGARAGAGQVVLHRLNQGGVAQDYLKHKDKIYCQSPNTRVRDVTYLLR